MGIRKYLYECIFLMMNDDKFLTLLFEKGGKSLYLEAIEFMNVEWLFFILSIFCAKTFKIDYI